MEAKKTKCKLCKYFELNLEELLEAKTYGFCCKSPPVPLPVPGGFMSRFPTVNLDSGCWEGELVSVKKRGK